MIFRKHSPRWALWVFAAALLLKSAMPLLATASAQSQGKALVEVCTVYGVALVPLAGESTPGPVEPAAGHAADHCVLTALAVLAPADAARPVGLQAAAVAGVGPPAALAAVAPPDPSADWVARLHHGPPAQS